MEGKGLIYKTDDKKYRMGQIFWQLAIGIFNKIDYLNIALPVMEKLSKITKETIIFWVVNSSYFTFIHRLNSDQPVQLVAELGARYPVLHGATSKMIIANMPDEDRDKYIKENFKQSQ